jgi:hypothetical protein
MQVAVAHLALRFLDAGHQIPGECAVERTADVRVGRSLRAAAAGDEQLRNVGVHHVRLLARGARGCPQFAADLALQLAARFLGHDVPRIGQVARDDRCIGRQDRAGVGARMAAVHDDGEADALLHAVEGGTQPVVGERILPVEVGGAQDLVAAVGLVAVLVRYVGTVAGVVQQQRVALGRAGDQRADGRLHVLLGGLEVEQCLDVGRPEAVVLLQDCREVLHVVDATPEIGPGDLVLVDADQQCSLGHVGRSSLKSEVFRFGRRLSSSGDGRGTTTPAIASVRVAVGFENLPGHEFCAVRLTGH